MPREFAITDQHKDKAQRLTRQWHTIAADAVGIPIRESERSERGGHHWTSERPGFTDRQPFLDAAREVAHETPFGDVAETIQTFCNEIRFAREWNYSIPMAHIREFGRIPILGGPPTVVEPEVSSLRRRHRDWLRWLGNLRWKNVEILLERPHLAFEQFWVGVGDFLNYRIAGFDYWFQNSADSITERGSQGPGSDKTGKGSGGGSGLPSTAPAGFLTVTLRCTNHNLRALTSLSIATDWRQFGNSPTTPVTGHLLPGLWLFAADGGVFGPEKVIDPVPARIPPDLTPCATHF